MATIDMSKVTDRDQRKAYQRMMGAGKSDKPRNIWSSDFRNNFDAIKWPVKIRHVKTKTNP